MPRKKRIVHEKEFKGVPHVSLDKAMEMLEPLGPSLATRLLKNYVLEWAARTYRGFTPGTLAKDSQSTVWLEKEAVRNVRDTFCPQKPGNKERL